MLKMSLLATIERSGLADTAAGLDSTNMSGAVSVVCVLHCVSLVFGVCSHAACDHAACAHSLFDMYMILASISSRSVFVFNVCERVSGSLAA